MEKIEHIGIAVKDLDVSNLIFENCLVRHKSEKWKVKRFRPRF
jgi:hypothetical protein